MMKRLLVTLSVLVSIAYSVPAWAAISCVDAGAVELATADPTDPQTISYTTPAGSNQVLFVGVGQRTATSAQTVTVTHAGNSMTATAATQYTDPSGASLFYIISPTAGTNDVVVDYGTAAPLDSAYIIWTCSGVKLSAPVHDANGATSTGTAITVTVANLVAGDVVVDFMASDDNTDGAEGANQTAIHIVSGGSNTAGASFQAAADGGVMSWTLDLSEQWSQQAVALTPATATARPIPPIFLGD